MMDHSELLKLIRQEVAKQIRVILSGVTDTNTQFNEDIGALYPGMDKYPLRPVMHPYGFASRAPAGTIQVTARQGDHPGNRLVLGHRDANRPNVAQQGEVVLYNAYGQLIRLKQGEILIGSDSASQPFVLGDVANTFLINLLELIEAHTHAGPGAPPTNAAAFTLLQEENLNNQAILSTEIFGQ